MPHVVLLGDSIFDNASYTAGQPDVIAQLQAAVNPDWRVSSCAVDGSMMQDIPAQISRIPTDATDLVVSIGGNNAIDNADVLTQPVALTAQALLILAERGDQFERSYRQTIRQLLRTGLKLIVCTIDNGNSPDLTYRRTVQTALMTFNDVILRVAFEFGLTVIDLRLVCSNPEDYANPIEPSAIGGAKIARAIAHSLRGSSDEISRVYVA